MAAEVATKPTTGKHAYDKTVYINLKAKDGTMVSFATSSRPRDDVVSKLEKRCSITFVSKSTDRVNETFVKAIIPLHLLLLKNLT